MTLLGMHLLALCSHFYTVLICKSNAFYSDHLRRNFSLSNGGQKLGKRRDAGERILPNLYGYDPDTSKWNPLAPFINSEKNTITEIFRLFLYEHKPANAIADILNKSSTHLPRKVNAKVGFTPRFIMNVLTRLEYCGLTKNSAGEIIESAIYKEIIPYKLYMQVDRFRSNKRRLLLIGSDQLTRFPLTGFMTCKVCEKRYYIKYPTNEKRTENYYYHYTKKCRSQSLIKPNAIHELVYTAFILSFTSRQALTRKLEAFAKWTRSVRYQDNILTLNKKVLSYWQYYKMNELLNNNWIKLKSGTMTFPQYLIEIEALIEDVIDDKNRDYIDDFIEHLTNVLQSWYSGTPNSKVDSIYDYIESISIREKMLIVTPFNSGSYEIDFDPPTSYWAKKKEEYKQLRTETFDGKKRKLSELSDYLHDLCEIISDEQATGLLMVANSFIEEKIISQKNNLNSANCYYYETSSFLNISNTKSTHSSAIIFRYSKSNRMYLKRMNESQEIKPFMMGDRVVGYEVAGDTYFNKAFLHSLPEWFYNYNAEYFKIGREKICFVKTDDNVKAYDLGKLGKKSEIPFYEAIQRIVQSETCQYIPLE